MRYAYSLIRNDRAKYPHHIAGFFSPCIKWYLDHQVAGGRGCPRILGRSAFWFVSRNRKTRYKTNQSGSGLMRIRVSPPRLRARVLLSLSVGSDTCRLIESLPTSSCLPYTILILIPWDAWILITS